MFPLIVTSVDGMPQHSNLCALSVHSESSSCERHKVLALTAVLHPSDVRPIPSCSVGPIESHTQQFYTSSPRSSGSATHELDRSMCDRNNARTFAKKICQSGTVAQQRNVRHRNGSGVKSLSIVIDTQSLLHIQPFDADRTKILGWSWILHGGGESNQQKHT